VSVAPKPIAQALVDERNALQVYFDALLREIPDELPEAPASIETPAPTAVVATPVAPAVAPAAAAVPAEIPSWGQSRFQAMLFKVGGLTLAVPLVELSGVQEWGAHKVTPLPNHVPWFLGLTRYRERSAPVIDTARLVLPDERRKLLDSMPSDRLTRIVFIDEGRWGLACDEVAEVVNLQTDQVRWRTTRTSRGWLAGTVIEHMCALIDPSAFARMLNSGIEEAGLELPPDEARE
jgi:purine-binding chemotaxis protein CheW